MDAQIEEILNQAYHLDRSQRAELATKLMESLDEKGELGLDADWEAEIQRRLDEDDEGEIVGTRWEDIYKRLREVDA